MAREKNFKGLFCAVPDPVDPLAKTAFLESNKNEAGEYDWMGLLPEQIQGFGLGVMNARAAYYAKRDPRFKQFLTEGRSFGPHGQDLVIADSIENYNDELSKELTNLTVTANLHMRAIGYKPFVAPAFSSGAISILDVEKTVALRIRLPRRRLHGREEPLYGSWNRDGGTGAAGKAVREDRICGGEPGEDRVEDGERILFLFYRRVRHHGERQITCIVPAKTWFGERAGAAG